jgi:hypothetical protein
MSKQQRPRANPDRRSAEAPPSPEPATPPPASRREATPSTYGHTHPTGSLLEELELPVLDDLEVVGWVRQALRDAVAHRQGVLVYGDKGTGRSEALQMARPSSGPAKKGGAARARGTSRTHLRVLPPMRPQTREELVRSVYDAEMGDIPYRFGRKGGADQMLGELVAGGARTASPPCCSTRPTASGPARSRGAATSSRGRRCPARGPAPT